jgi:hypothetical protein
MPDVQVKAEAHATVPATLTQLPAIFRKIGRRAKKTPRGERWKARRLPAFVGIDDPFECGRFQPPARELRR